MTWLVFLVVIIFGVVAYRENLVKPTSSTRRRTLAWGWAFWGAIIGTFFGIAGFGSAIAGTGVGALIGYLGASAWLKTDPPDNGEAGASGDKAIFGAAVSEEDGISALEPPCSFDSGDMDTSPSKANIETPIVGEYQAGDLPDQYFERIQILNSKIKAAELITVSATHVLELSRQLVCRSREEAGRLEEGEIWWVEGDQLFIFVKNREAFMLAALEFTLTPGPCGQAEGLPLPMLLEFSRGIPGVSERVVVFKAPSGYFVGSRAKVHCGIITRAWSYA